MTLRQVVWFIAAHIALVALAIWFNLAVLCQGDAKFSGGCGGFGLYIPLWEVFLAPLALAAIVLERWGRAQPPPTLRLLVYLGATVFVAEVGFLLIDKFPVLLALEAVIIALEAVLRWRTIRLFFLVGLLAPCKQAVGQSPACPPFDTTAAWARTSRTWSNESGLHWSNDSLRRVLISLGERDQAPRAEFGAHVTDTLYVRQLRSLDSTLAAEMVLILDRFGLPTRSMVGPAGSDAAMLIIQHSWPLQERALASAKAIPAGQISPEKLAMLEDRVLVHQGQPQRFGTQFNAGPGGVFRFAPVSDTTGLDARRSAAGMPPMRQYVCLLEEAGMRVDRASLPGAFRP